ncbi:cytochrome ubiquinol oxidase subunit I [Tepidibacillus sp. HK-1]|uniref:cytochrome ubiquinol oxidase subunit I n=1 Tax=Tepidibacillus sp. HK-1 TaxID=1883407 RepID=UPI0008539E4C|nr:cytochrome ubiquinol oxidase subunit I [Tepidibacillus sp. HK-1]GBF10941.1 cytochrome bd ubiquinol oxidase subunit 1 [Tepidibacillus sp. HK-1]
MDVVTLSRLQFAITIGFHFLFVPLTLGLVILVAIMETLYVKTNDIMYKKMAKFWGKLFIINFALGVVTGITMEFQFGTNWSEYSKYVGDIFGAPLAIEATVAFFLESTFLGVWIYGWDRLSKKLHAFAIWMVALGTNLSAVWIIIANGWMQHPVGYVLRNGRAELVDFMAVVTNKYAWLMFFHTVLSGYVLSAFFVLGISAYHLLRHQHLDFFKKSFRIALIFAIFSSIGVAVLGDLNGSNVADVQPAKFAAMESIWETQQGAPMYLLQIPDEKNEGNRIETLGIPKLTSFLAFKDPNATIKGLKDFPLEERPPVNLTFYAFRIMVGLGVYFILMSFIGWYLQRKNKLLDSRLYLKMMLYSIPLPYIAINLGWVVAEVGRQPWIVYGLMKTADAVSPIPASNVLTTLIGVVVFYTILIVADLYLLVKYAKMGPDFEKPTKIHIDQSTGFQA